MGLHLPEVEKVLLYYTSTTPGTLPMHDGNMYNVMIENLILETFSPYLDPEQVRPSTDQDTLSPPRLQGSIEPSTS